MTKEEQLKQFGEEVPAKYIGFVQDRDPMWSREHYKKALEVARKYDSEILEENSKSDSV